MITKFMQSANGGHRRKFVVDGITVIVEPHENDAAAADLAELLSTATHRLNALGEQVRNLSAQVPPNAPARLIGPGFVRMRGGELWLLGKRETGWAAFGFRLDGWDDLFRRYAVYITESGQDEHGNYWIAVPAKPSRTTEGG